TPFYGSPYVAEVTVTARSASGQAIVGEDTLNVSINPVEAAVISTLDDPSTPDQNEFQSLSGSFPLGTSAGGQATVFVHSSFTPGPATLSVSFTDPDTGQVVTGQYVINIASSAPPLPANVEVGPSGRPVYVVGSGGPAFTTFSVRVEDGSGEEVPDPVSGNTAFNNVRLEIIGDGIAAGEQLSGVNAQGQNV